MIDYEGRTETPSAFPETVPVSVLEYRELVESAEKGRVMADGILSAMSYEGSPRYGRRVSLVSEVVISIFRAVYPEDYDFWLEDEKKKLAEETVKEAEQ